MQNFMFTRAGKEWNEDRGYVSENFGFVLDGATSVAKKKYSSMSSDAEWYSEKWCEYLCAALKDTSKSILSILEEGFDKISGDFKKLLGGASIEDFPSTTLSLVRENNDELEFYTIGDSSILVENIYGEVCIFQDTRNIINDFVVHAEVKEAALKDNIDIIAARKKYPEYVLVGRKKSNSYGGYYVLSSSKSAIRAGIYQTMPKRLVKKVLLMTDGYAQIVDTFKFMTKEDLTKKLNSEADAEKFYNKLFVLQQKDKFGDKCPRFKITDDATVVCMNY